MSASSQIAALIALIAVNVCLGRISIRHARELTAAQLLSVLILGDKLNPRVQSGGGSFRDGTRIRRRVSSQRPGRHQPELTN